MKHVLLSFFILFSLSVLAQHSVQSSVFDSKNAFPIEMVTVRLLQARDSSLVQGCQTDSKGGFILHKVKPGNYVLKVTMVGYVDYRQKVLVVNKDVILKNIELAEDSHMLNEVKITGTAAQMVVKGDTSEYNALAFKTTQNAVVEDLLKRLPGVEVGTDGKITVNGQDIKKIRIDGKKFFGDDVEMATKNIPADMIDKIQVYDQKSDMAKLTGFEDNDTERIINLTTKSNRKKGVFGNVTGGAGLDVNKDVRYDGNAFLNIMNGDAQTAITAGGNNTNTSRSGRGRSGMGNPSGGITSMQNLGVNNNTILNPKLKIGGDVSFNHSDNYSVTETNKESYLKTDSITQKKYTDQSNSTSNIGNYSANMRLEVEWKPDTLNTIVLQPTIGYNNGLSSGNSTYTYLTGTDVTSKVNSLNEGYNSSIDASLNLIYSHKFTSKIGRTFTANLQTGLSHSNSESWNVSNKISLGIPTNINQYTTNLTNNYSASIRLSYVEPLWNVRNLLEMAVSMKTTNNESDKTQYNKDAAGTYMVRDSAYSKDNAFSNNFQNTFLKETLELNYRYVAKDYNLMLGVKAEPSQTSYLRSYSDGAVKDTTYGVFNVSPTGRFQYNFGKKKFVRVDYRGQTNQPSISQMQPVKNNSNLMNEIVGNPTLNPEFNHNLRMFYSAFNEVTFSSFNVMLNASATKDALTTNSIYDKARKQYSQTINATDVTPFNLFGNIMFNTPIIQKRLQFSTNTSFGLDQRYGYSKKDVDSINTSNLLKGDQSETRKYSGSETVSLTFTTDVIEIGTRGTLRYSNTYNNLVNTTSQTYDWTAGGNVVLHLPYNINIASDLNFTTLQGYSNFDNNQLIWNASVDKSFFNNKGVLSLKLFDILHQQLNIRQTIGDNYIQYSKYNTLTTYFLLSFSLKINKFNGSKNPADQRPDFNRFGPGGDHPHHDHGDRPGGFGGGGGGPQF